MNLTGDAIARSLGRSYVPADDAERGRVSARRAARDPGRGPLRSALQTGEPVVEDVSFSVGAGEILGLVGESGSGKTTTALALLGYTRPGVRDHAAARVEVGGESVLGRDRRVAARPARQGWSPTCRRIRAARSTRRCGSATRSWTCCARTARAAASRRVGAARRSSRVELGADAALRPALPAPALRRPAAARDDRDGAASCEPPVAVLDEPTTGLDVLTQDRILAELLRLRDEDGMAMVYVSHDLAVVAQMADRIVVMYAGRVVEEGPAAEVIERPRHPYTRGAGRRDPRLPAAARAATACPASPVGVGEWPPGCAFAPRCAQRTPRCDERGAAARAVGARPRVRCFRWQRRRRAAPCEPARTRRRAARGRARRCCEVAGLRGALPQRAGADVAAVHDVVVHDRARARCVALVGESGSGKTTIGRCIAGLHVPAGGPDRCSTASRWPARPARAPLEQRRRDPDRLPEPVRVAQPAPPRRATSIERPLRVLRGLVAARGASARSASCWSGCGCRRGSATASRSSSPAASASGSRSPARWPPSPDLLICDEVTSALDVSVQAAVLELLRRAAARARPQHAVHHPQPRRGGVHRRHGAGDGAGLAARDRARSHRCCHIQADDYTRRLLSAAPCLPDAAVS